MRSNNLLFVISYLVIIVLVLTSTIYFPNFLDLSQKVDDAIFFKIRLPKYGIAFVAGAGLALSGYLCQLLLNNPLAEPYTLGVSGGAGLAVNLASFFHLPLFFNSIYLPQIYAFLGASIATFCLFVLLKKQSSNSVGILLVGLAINFLASAIISLLIYLSPDNNQIREISFWFMGSYTKVTQMDFFISLGITFILSLMTMLSSKKILNLHLGLQRLNELGFETNRITKTLILIISAFTALIVAICGPIGFIGLLAPHLVRQLKFDVKWVLVHCFFLGGMITLLAEVISTLVLPTIHLPPGIVTSIIGIPVFIYLLVKNYNFVS